MDPVQEIKIRLPIEEVVAQYVPLKKAGRSLKGLCPFHTEKTPSFIVSPDKGLAYCFGCQKGGDLFRFIMEVEHLDFRGALELLADRAGVVLPDQSPAIRHEKSLILDLQKRAQAFFQATLRGPDGAVARTELERRGVTAEMIERFGIGAAPASWDALTKAFTAKGVTEKELVTAGLAIRRDQDRDGVYDRFRSRIMFPLRDSSGKVLAFTGRSLDGTEPKYLNSPESATFSKGSFLYGIDLARDAMKKEGKALLVEGQMDVLTFHQFGYPYAVATSGTALTEHHMEAVSKIVSQVLFCYDHDEAGAKATLRGLHFALNAGLGVRIVALTAGKDPDDALRNDAASVASAVAAPQTVSEFLMERLRSKYKLSDADEKRMAVSDFYEFVREVRDPLVSDALLTDAAGIFNIRPEYFQDDFKHYRMAPSARPDADMAPSFRPEEILLGLVLNRPALWAMLAAHARGGEIFSADARRLFDVLARVQEEQPEASAPEVLAAFPDDLRQRAELVILAAEEHEGADDPDAVEREVRLLLNRIVGEYVKRRTREIAGALREIDPAQEQLLMEELRELQRIKV